MNETLTPRFAPGDLIGSVDVSIFTPGAILFYGPIGAESVQCVSSQATNFPRLRHASSFVPLLLLGAGRRGSDYTKNQNKAQSRKLTVSARGGLVMNQSVDPNAAACALKAVPEGMRVIAFNANSDGLWSALKPASDGSRSRKGYMTPETRVKCGKDAHPDRVAIIGGSHQKRIATPLDVCASDGRRTSTPAVRGPISPLTQTLDRKRAPTPLVRVAHSEPRLEKT